MTSTVSTSFLGMKSFFTMIGGFLLMIGSTLEPNVAIWIISLGGSLLYIAIGQDQSLKNIFFNLIIGLFFGIFGSQLMHIWEPLLPQIAVSFFLSMFGVSTTQYILRNLKTTSFVDIISAIISKIIPWSSEKSGKK